MRPDEQRAKDRKNRLWCIERRRLWKIEDQRRKTPKPVLKKFGAIRIMIASNEYFSRVTATWKQTGPTQWKCVRADTGLSFMIDMPLDLMKNDLIRRGFKWQWI